jgi:PilZ domain
VSIALPGAGQSVTLVDHDGREHRSELHDPAEAGRLTMLRPPGLASGVTVLIGAEMTMTWPLGANMVGQIPTRLAAIRRTGEDQFWDLEPLGEPLPIQRRAHPRVPVSTPVTVSQILELAAPRRSVGMLVDLSELAVRCSLDTTEIWATRRGTQLRVSFQLDGLDVDLAGRVISAALTADRREVVVRFDQPAEQLRGFISKWAAPDPH